MSGNQQLRLVKSQSSTQLDGRQSEVITSMGQLAVGDAESPSTGGDPSPGPVHRLIRIKPRILLSPTDNCTVNFIFSNYSLPSSDGSSNENIATTADAISTGPDTDNDLSIPLINCKLTPRPANSRKSSDNPGRASSVSGDDAALPPASLPSCPPKGNGNFTLSQFQWVKTIGN